MINQRAAKLELQCEFATLSICRISTELDLTEGIAKVVNHLGEGEPPGRTLCGLLIVINRSVRYPSLCKVPSDHLGFCSFARRVRLQHLTKSVVDRVTLVAQQRSVGSILHQCMSEGVTGERRLTACHYDFSVHALGECIFQGFWWQLRYSLQKVK